MQDGTGAVAGSLSQPGSSVFPPCSTGGKQEEPSANSQRNNQREGTKLAPWWGCLVHLMSCPSPAFPGSGQWQCRCLTQCAKLISSLVWRAQPALHTARSSASWDQHWLIPTEVLL